MFAVNSMLALASLAGSPAPQGIGPWEVALAGGVVLAVGVLLVARFTRDLAARSREQLVPLLLLPAIGIPVLTSVAVGTVAGIPLDGAVRASAPYVLFLPVILLGLVVGPAARLWVITVPLVVSGALQAIYLLGLFFVTVPDAGDFRNVFLLRTTLLDARTTLPLLLAAATLPLAWGDRGSTAWRRLGGGALALLALGAALSTQTRSQMIAVVVGIVTYLIVNGARGLRRTGATWATVGRRIGTRIVLAALVVTIISLALPPTRTLLQAAVQRSRTDLDTGRWRDEWEPATEAVLDRGIPGVAVGIGAGESFITAAGEERTYVHNLLLYGLVYFGGPGLGLILLGYVILFLGLLRRGARMDDPRYAALAAMIVSMFVFAQFFAVHKLFSYNLMLALAAQALTQPPVLASEAR